MSTSSLGSSYLKISRFSWLLGNAGAQVVGAVCGMATNVLYAHLLNLSDVGVIALAHSLAIFLTVFSDRGLGTWITREFRDRNLEVSSAVRILLLSAAGPFVGFLMLISLVLQIPAVVDSFWSDALFWCLPLTVCYWSFQMALSLTQGMGLPHGRALLLVVNGLLTVGVTALALVEWPTIASAVIATAIAYLAVGVIGTICLFRSFKRQNVVNSVATPGVDRATALRESRRLFATNVAVFSLSAGDVIAASFCMSSSQVGVYQLLKKISQGLILPVLSVLPVALGRISGASDVVASRYIQRAILFAGIYLASLILLGWLGFPVLTRVLFGADVSIYGGLAVVLLLAFGMQLLKDSMAIYFNAVRLDGVPAMTNWVVVVLFFALVGIGNSSLGLVGFCWALALSFFVGFLLSLAMASESVYWSSGLVLWTIIRCNVLFFAVFFCTAIAPMSLFV